MLVGSSYMTALSILIQNICKEPIVHMVTNSQVTPDSQLFYTLFHNSAVRQKSLGIVLESVITVKCL